MRLHALLRAHARGLLPQPARAWRRLPSRRPAPQVEDIDASQLTPDGAGAARVTARLHEAGDLFAATGKRSEGHCYDNAYTVEYTLTRAPDGGWRIADALVTGTT